MKQTICTGMKELLKYRVRILLGLTLVLLLYLTPELTSAQYRWTLNGSSIIQAKEFYFRSNLLKTSASSGYGETTGWNGISSPLSPVEIQNYENTLLANKTGEDVKYKITWSITTYDSSGTEKTGNDAYTFRSIKVTKSDGDENNKTLSGTVLSFESEITGDGTTKSDKYTFEIDKPTNHAGDDWIPDNGSSILITITAETLSDTNGYNRKLYGSFKYIVSTQEGFIKKFDVTETEGTKDFVLTIGTDTVPDSQGAAQSITVWWDADRIDINPMNSTFVQMFEAGNYHEYTTDAGRKYYTLKITNLSSRAYRYLNLYKKNQTDAYGTVIHSRNDTWFTEDALGNLIAKRTNPQTGLAAGAILGYWFES